MYLIGKSLLYEHIRKHPEHQDAVIFWLMTFDEYYGKHLVFQKYLGHTGVQRGSGGIDNDQPLETLTHVALQTVCIT